ncbi:peptidase S13 D-Ala-D-Ala carboxypeptidase C [Stanieria cyanosphaera PCC 7437]|uniref:Peptidase S13 D-Ala-D-Ala carboxypeptidase C n=1 Tax=Stanieria cyanosphaera (strain ATCC 29371 / PCC 7437) TaxID=111780 RepID=K9XT89_STAC7|nr:D-alanyl-D-alanine carboxypeptidase [Stanieria cyanosphaera]AFZ34882.1 peptidase S13 D-Ala-D-Ala carboxypeptidase C [Stanieria cyanosphaera PCC 7437]
MLDFIGSSLINLFLEIFGRSQIKLEPLQLIAWQNAAIFTLPPVQPDLVAEKIVQNYLQNLSQAGIDSNQQGIWLQSDWTELVNHQGTIAIPAASLTKIATTLAALLEWSPDYQFETSIYTNGKIVNGILTGDLIVTGSGDPFFVWEEAIALGNALQQLGITQVQGNLIVTDKFYMNYESDAQRAGELLKQAFNANLWSNEAKQQYSTLPPDTPKPQIAILGKVQISNSLPSSTQLLLTRSSLPLSEILKQMNIYSNNKMAQMLADLLGGANQVAYTVAQAIEVSQSEIQLINGSGLGEENRLSPRAVCRMLMKIDSLLSTHPLEVADLLPTAGRDRVGTMQNRSIPVGISVKTGTLNRVSALAGTIPTQTQGQIWFAIINSGNQTDYYRQQQDRLIKQLAQHWQLQKTTFNNSATSYLGDPKRNFQAEL